jgi:4'-phosphopantetheinyl transferase
MIRYNYGDHGKPRLANSTLHSLPSFNLSNSGELAMLGLVREHEIGVDVEKVCEVADLEALASQCFSASEQKTLLALPTELRLEAFFRCWTRKEAYVKALGVGFSARLDSFDVTMASNEVARVSIEGGSQGATSCSLFHLQPADGYVGAAAIVGGPSELRVSRFHLSFDLS